MSDRFLLCDTQHYVAQCSAVLRSAVAGINRLQDSDIDTLDVVHNHSLVWTLWM